MSSNYEKLEEVGGTPARSGAYDPHPAPPSSPPPVVAAASPAVAVAPGQQQIPTAAAAPQGAVPTAFAMPAGAHGVPVHAQLHAASAGMYPVVMPDLPDAVEAWNGLQGLMQWYLSFSIVLIFISFFIFGLLFFIFLPSGLMGTIAASMHLNERCRGRGSVIGAVGTIRVLSAVAATLDMIFAGIFFLVTLAAGGKAVGFFVALTMIYGGHGLISIHVFNQSSRVADAVNPVTRGVVVL